MVTTPWHHTATQKIQNQHSPDFFKSKPTTFCIWSSGAQTITAASEFKIFFFLHCFCSASAQNQAYFHTYVCPSFYQVSSCSTQRVLLIHSPHNSYCILHVHGRIHFYRKPHAAVGLRTPALECSISSLALLVGKLWLHEVRATFVALRSLNDPRIYNR